MSFCDTIIPVPTACCHYTHTAGHWPRRVCVVMVLLPRTGYFLGFFFAVFLAFLAGLQQQAVRTPFGPLIAAWAAASLAIGTRYGLHET